MRQRDPGSTQRLISSRIAWRIGVCVSTGPDQRCGRTHRASCAGGRCPCCTQAPAPVRRPGRGDRFAGVERQRRRAAVRERFRTGSMLLEWLDSTTELISVADDLEALQILSELLARLTAVPAPPGLRLLSEHGAGLLGRLQAALARTLPGSQRSLLVDCAFGVEGSTRRAGRSPAARGSALLQHPRARTGRSEGTVASHRSQSHGGRSGLRPLGCVAQPMGRGGRDGRCG